MNSQRRELENKYKSVVSTYLKTHDLSKELHTALYQNLQCVFFYLFLLKNFRLLPTSHFPPPPPTPLPFSVQSKEQLGFPALWEVQGPPSSIQVQEGAQPNRLGSHKASTCSRIKTQCHCPWLLSPHCPPRSESPVWSHAFSVSVRLALVSSH